MTSTPTLPARSTQAPQVAVNDIGSEEDFLAAIDATIKYFDDGDIVEGTIVKVDRDESTSATSSRPWSCRRRTRRAG